MGKQNSTSVRSHRISKLLKSQESRAAYIKAKLAVLVPAQIRALRLKSVNPLMPKQSDLARESQLHQSRISMFETPGMANVTLETLAKVSAGLRSGVVIKFVPFSEMLAWENSFSPESFDVLRLDEDRAFIGPQESTSEFQMSGIGASKRSPIATLKTSGSAASRIDESAFGSLTTAVPNTGAKPMELPHAG